MEKLIVLVLEGEYRLTAAVLFCLSRDRRVELHMVSRETTSPFRYSRYVHSHHRRPQPEFDADFATFVRQVAARTQAGVLLPIDVEGMRFCIACRPELEQALHLLPLPSAHAYEIAADKSWLASFMLRQDIPGPTTITHLGPHLPEQLATLRFPVLLKPTGGEGGTGIQLFRELEPLLAHVAQLPHASKYIVQTYLEGYDIDCNVLCQDGQVLAHSIQRGLLPAANAYAPTQAIEFVQNDAVLAVVQRLMHALHWSGVAHLDLRYDADSNTINVIEINPRFWLTVVGSAVAARVNFPVLACQAALHRPVAPPPFALGRYIPFTTFLRYRFLSRLRDKVRFTFRNTSLLSFLGDPLPKLFYLLAPRSVRVE